jgi:amino acid adenylation domain-containing protein
LPAPETRKASLLHEWLRQTAATFPDFAAIVEEDRVTTFAQLLAQAESLSSTLLQLGVQKGDRVALILSKTTEAIISIFASLFAGAIYVPIQPRWPKERIEATLEDCAPKVVFTALQGTPQITDRDGSVIAEWRSALASAPAGSHPLPGIQDTDPALILFTSGSTGQPKGVVLSHAAVAAFVKWTADEFQIGPADRIATPSPLGFDLSTFDIFNMALRGAACVLVPDSVVWMPRFLVEFVRQSRITCWYSVPSILAGMLDEGRFANHPHPDLRLVLFAGEVFASQNVVRLQRVLPHALCVNLYGPTETNVVTWCPVPSDFDPSGLLPIGGPCPYAEVTMDPSTGELLAGGESTMIGYWNRPEETDRAFVVIEGKRYYRTGDRVSADSSGQYTFVGRLDRQVKRRGFRIELGEIEAALLRHDAVLEAAAVAWDPGNSNTAIGAFVRLRSAGALTLIDAKAHCARSLPHYMLPDRIVFMDAIPKGNRGKIDYAALRRIAEEPGHGD